MTPPTSRAVALRQRLLLAAPVLVWIAGSFVLLVLKRSLPIQLRGLIVFGTLLAAIWIVGVLRARWRGRTESN
jgi:hypothetical protein